MQFCLTELERLFCLSDTFFVNIWSENNFNSNSLSKQLKDTAKAMVNCSDGLPRKRLVSVAFARNNLYA